MPLLRTISDNIGVFLNIFTVICMVMAVIYFFSKRLGKKKLEMLSAVKERIKTLKDKKIDDFNFTSLEVTRLIDISQGVAKKRGVFCSNNSCVSIDATSFNGVLKLNYKYLFNDPNNWGSFVVTGIEELEDYYEQGYYLIFKCKSNDVKTLILEGNQFWGKDKAVDVVIKENSEIYYFCKLKELFSSPNDLKEICFVIRPYKGNKLKGKVEISDFKVVKNIRCKKKKTCNNYKNMKGGAKLKECSCGNKYMDLMG
ncbi:hypothetical protein QBE53_06425 [Vallitaleaceae bacterium 9-2]